MRLKLMRKLGNFLRKGLMYEMNNKRLGFPPNNRTHGNGQKERKHINVYILTTALINKMGQGK